MAYSQDDLIREVVAEVYGLASGQQPETEDAARVAARIPAALAEMGRLNIFYIPDGESVPDEAFNSVVTYIAQVLAPSFLQPRNQDAQDIAESKLRTLQRLGRGTGQMLRVDRALSSRRWGC